MAPARFKPGLYATAVFAALGLTLIVPVRIAFVLPTIACSLALYGGFGGVCRWGRLSRGQRSGALWLLVLGVPLLRVMLDVCL